MNNEALTYELVLAYIRDTNYTNRCKIIDALENDILDCGFVNESEVDDLRDEINTLEQELHECQQEMEAMEENWAPIMHDDLYNQERWNLLQEAYRRYDLHQLQTLFQWQPGAGITKVIKEPAY